MQVVDARQPPELLPGDKTHAEVARPAEHPPTVAVPVDRNRRVPPQRHERRQPDAVHAHHDACAAGRHHLVVPAQHVIDFAGDIGGVHHLLSGALGVPRMHAHHRLQAFGERAMRSVALQFVVLDEIDSAFGQRAPLRP